MVTFRTHKPLISVLSLKEWLRGIVGGTKRKLNAMSFCTTVYAVDNVCLYSLTNLGGGGGGYP